MATGEAPALAANDNTAHVEVGNLEPATTYWYRFEGEGEHSPVGRTRTAPAPGRAIDGQRLRIGLVSCASLRTGYFSAYRHLARRELDLVVHVGDYIYEGGTHSTRGVRASRLVDPPHTLVSLADYRTRHAQYRGDADLLALHARHPMAVVWDDHDVAGSTWNGGAGAHRPSWQGDWSAREAAAVQAWREWVPIRSVEPARPRQIYRTIQLGGLADLFMLDTRLVARERPAAAGLRPVATVKRRDRSLLGPAQWEWLESGLDNSTAHWKMLGNQVVMAPIAALGLGPGFGRNPDQWDGYPGERDRLLAGAARRGDQMVVLSGDLHSSWASELGSGVEFVTPAVSATPFCRLLLPPGKAVAGLVARWFQSQNPHVRFCDLRRSGYV
ncbi:MAG: alkaline phosphatase D family protein, partial [Pseudonocardiaceae bacterium]